MTDLLYTVKGQLLCNCCPLKAGDTVDIPITVEGIVGVPESIRAIVQLVEEITVEDCDVNCEGRRYTLQYDETLLGPNLSELNVNQVGIPTCVDPVTLSNEYTDTSLDAAKEYADNLLPLLSETGVLFEGLESKATAAVSLPGSGTFSVYGRAKLSASDSEGYLYEVGNFSARYSFQVISSSQVRLGADLIALDLPVGRVFDFEVKYAAGEAVEVLLDGVTAWTGVSVATYVNVSGLSIGSTNGVASGIALFKLVVADQAEYLFDEGEGATLNDQTANGNDATLEGFTPEQLPTWVRGDVVTTSGQVYDEVTSGALEFPEVVARFPAATISASSSGTVEVDPSRIIRKINANISGRDIYHQTEILVFAEPDVASNGNARIARFVLSGKFGEGATVTELANTSSSPIDISCARVAETALVSVSNADVAESCFLLVRAITTLTEL